MGKGHSTQESESSIVLRWEVHTGTSGRSKDGKASRRRQPPSGVFREEKAIVKQKHKGRERALLLRILTAKSTEYLLPVRCTLLVLSQ